jgi:hypothetical protein
MTFRLNHNDREHIGDVFNAMAAIKEEGQLEALVSVTGEQVAQRAAESHSLPVFVAAVQLDRDPWAC